MTHATASPDAAPRLAALDGLRGAAMITVLLAHCFGEVPQGPGFLAFGWVAVIVFFALSGYLIGKLILDHKHRANFFAVFYVRRCARILPPYVITVVVIWALLTTIDAPWMHRGAPFPLWSYLTFSQGFCMAAARDVGLYYLTPTWTLAVEEHFYLIAPVALCFAPRRWLVPGLLAIAVGSLCLRAAIYFFGIGNHYVALLLPGRADAIAFGVLAAIAVNENSIDWRRYRRILLAAPPVAFLCGAFVTRLYGDHAFNAFAPTLLGAGSAALIVLIANGQWRPRFLESRVMTFLGDTSYCTYLTHLAVLGLAHGFILNAVPGLATPAQWAVTLAALPVSVLVGWAMTRLVEPVMASARASWRWSAASRGPNPPLGAMPQSAPLKT